MCKSTRFYLASAILSATGIVLTLLGDRQAKRERNDAVWAKASDEDKKADGVSGIPGE